VLGCMVLGGVCGVGLGRAGFFRGGVHMGAHHGAVGNSWGVGGARLWWQRCVRGHVRVCLKSWPLYVWADPNPAVAFLPLCRGMPCASACTSAPSPSGPQQQPSRRAHGSSRSRQGRQRWQTWLVAAALRAVVHPLALAWPALLKNWRAVALLVKLTLLQS
jgi:hypothetical protein